MVGVVPPTLPAALLADTKVLPPRGLNTSAYLHVNTFARHTAWAHGFMHAYALWLGLVLLVAAFVLAYAVAWWRGAVGATALLMIGGIGTLVALGLNQVVGHAAKELRPYVTHPDSLVLVAKANDYGFPSDHAVIAGALIASILLVAGPSPWSGPALRRTAAEGPAAGTPTALQPPAWAWLVVVDLVLGLFLCFSRVYVGVHYPGDVVAGLLLGAVVVGALSLVRPLAFRLAHVIEPTALAACLRRPRAMSETGHPSAAEVDDRARP